MSRGSVLALVLAILTLTASTFWYLSHRTWVAPFAVEAVFEDSASGVLPAFLHEQAGERTEYPDILLRPVFRPDRRRPVASAPAPTPVKVDAAPIPAQENTALNRSTLAGIFSSGSATWVLVVEGQQAHRVEVGQSVAGWRLGAVGERWAEFVSPQGQTRRLVMKPANTESAPTPAPRSRERSIANPSDSPDATPDNQPNGRNIKP